MGYKIQDGKVIEVVETTEELEVTSRAIENRIKSLKGLVEKFTKEVDVLGKSHEEVKKLEAELEVKEEVVVKKTTAKKAK